MPSRPNRSVAIDGKVLMPVTDKTHRGNCRSLRIDPRSTDDRSYRCIRLHAPRTAPNNGRSIGGIQNGHITVDPRTRTYGVVGPYRHMVVIRILIVQHPRDIKMPRLIDPESFMPDSCKLIALDGGIASLLDADLSQHRAHRRVLFDFKSRGSQHRLAVRDVDHPHIQRRRIAPAYGVAGAHGEVVLPSALVIQRFEHRDHPRGVDPETIRSVDLVVLYGTIPRREEPHLSYGSADCGVLLRLQALSAECRHDLRHVHHIDRHIGGRAVGFGVGGDRLEVIVRPCLVVDGSGSVDGTVGINGEIFRTVPFESDRRHGGGTGTVDLDTPHFGPYRNILSDLPVGILKYRFVVEDIEHPHIQRRRIAPAHRVAGTHGEPVLPLRFVVESLLQTDRSLFVDGKGAVGIVDPIAGNGAVSAGGFGKGADHAADRGVLFDGEGGGLEHRDRFGDVSHGDMHPRRTARSGTALGHDKQIVLPLRFIIQRMRHPESSLGIDAEISASLSAEAEAGNVALSRIRDGDLTEHSADADVFIHAPGDISQGGRGIGDVVHVDRQFIQGTGGKPVIGAHLQMVAALPFIIQPSRQTHRPVGVDGEGAASLQMEALDGAAARIDDADTPDDASRCGVFGDVQHRRRQDRMAPQAVVDPDVDPGGVAAAAVIGHGLDAEMVGGLFLVIQAPAHQTDDPLVVDSEMFATGSAELIVIEMFPSGTQQGDDPQHTAYRGVFGNPGRESPDLHRIVPVDDTDVNRTRCTPSGAVSGVDSQGIRPSLFVVDLGAGSDPDRSVAIDGERFAPLPFQAVFNDRLGTAAYRNASDIGPYGGIFVDPGIQTPQDGTAGIDIDDLASREALALGVGGDHIKAQVGLLFVTGQGPGGAERPLRVNGEILRCATTQLEAADRGAAVAIHHDPSHDAARSAIFVHMIRPLG